MPDGIEAAAKSSEGCRGYAEGSWCSGCCEGMSSWCEAGSLPNECHVNEGASEQKRWASAVAGLFASGSCVGGAKGALG